MQHISISNQQQQKQQYFCFLMIRTFSTSIFGYVYLLLNIVFFILICFEINKLKRIGLFSRVSLALRILCIWSGLSLVQIGYYQYTYNYLDRHPDLTNEEKSTISSIEFIITFLQVFLIHTTLVLAPYYWHSNIIYYLQNQSTVYENQEEKKDFIENIKSNFDWIIKKFLHWYLIIRTVILSVLIVLLCVFASSKNQQLKEIFAQTTYIIVLFDSFFILIIYILGLVAIKKNIKLSSIMQDEQLKKILNRYMLVIGTTIFRLIIFFLRNPLGGIFRSSFMVQQCENKFETIDQEWKNFVFIMFQSLIMDFLPAFIIYYIYRVPKQKKQSLLNQQRNSNEQMQ